MRQARHAPTTSPSPRPGQPVAARSSRAGVGAGVGMAQAWGASRATGVSSANVICFVAMSQERLQEAMRQFRLRQARASNRQEAIQTYCCDELERRGLLGARIEVILPGAYRDKTWDVGRLSASGEVTLGISCKSIISNHGGTVPNRIDDMLGEAVNLHRRWPSAVLGYLFMMAHIDESKDQIKRREARIQAGAFKSIVEDLARKSGDAWFQRLGDSVSRASGRTSAEDFPEKFEATSCSLLDFDLGEPYPVQYHPATPSPDAFFDQLVAIHRERFG